MRKIYAIFLFIICVLFISSFQGFDVYAALLKSFDDCNLKYEKTAISGWVSLNKPYGGSEDTIQLAQNVYDSIAESLGYGKGIYDTSDEKFTIKGALSGDSISVSLSPYIKEGDSKYDQIVSVDITQRGSVRNIIGTRRGVENCLLKYGDDAHINVCITGFLEGKADKNTSEKIIKDILKDLGIMNAKCYNSENIISAYGYTRTIPGYISCGGKNINVDMACRYSSYDNKTYFLLGTPVICSEY